MTAFRCSTGCGSIRTSRLLDAAIGPAPLAVIELIAGPLSVLVLSCCAAARFGRPGSRPRPAPECIAYRCAARPVLDRGRWRDRGGLADPLLPPVGSKGVGVS